MHSSRMRTACSLTVSRRIPRMPCCHHACPQQTRMPPTTTYTPLQPHTPHNYACPLQPCTPPTTMHTPHNHACPPSTHTPPPCGQTDTCKKHNLSKLRLRAVMMTFILTFRHNGRRFLLTCTLLHLRLLDFGTTVRSSIARCGLWRQNRFRHLHDVWSKRLRWCNPHFGKAFR